MPDEAILKCGAEIASLACPARTGNRHSTPVSHLYLRYWRRQ
jgi:hypothetical protein